jgi:hypothetical protein
LKHKENRYSNPEGKEMTTTETPQVPALTAREAEYLNSLRRAADNYSRALEALQVAAAEEVRLLTENFRASGIGNQRLMEAATTHATLMAVLDGHYAAQEMRDREAWFLAIKLAYTGKVGYFRAAE